MRCQVHGDSSSKPAKGDQYLRFDRGSLLSACRKTDKYRADLFMPHHQQQVRLPDLNSATRE